MVCLVIFVHTLSVSGAKVSLEKGHFFALFHDAVCKHNINSIKA